MADDVLPGENLTLLTVHIFRPKKYNFFSGNCVTASCFAAFF